MLRIPIAWHKARIPVSFYPKNRDGKGQVVLSGEGRKVPKMSLALEQPRFAPVQPWRAQEQEIIWGLSGPRPKRTTCSLPYRFSVKNRNSGLVPGIGIPRQCERKTPLLMPFKLRHQRQTTDRRRTDKEEGKREGKTLLTSYIKRLIPSTLNGEWVSSSCFSAMQFRG